MPDAEIRPRDYAYTFSPHLEPTATVWPGDRVIVHTDDAMGSRISSESDLPSKALAGVSPNPLTGPIFVEGAEPGDTLRVYIEDIEPARDFAVSCFIPNMGGLTSTGFTRTLQDPSLRGRGYGRCGRGPRGDTSRTARSG
jgi:amidase